MTKTSEPVATPTAEVEEVETVKPSVPETPTTAFSNKLSDYIGRVSVLNKELKDLDKIGKGLEKDYISLVKQFNKKTKVSRNAEDRPLSGFAMPSLLSPELYGFLNIEPGTKVPRKDVTRMINEYIKSNDLRDSNDRRCIKPNAELHKIFKSSDTDKITYFNLQSYMKHHFVKEPVATTA